MKKIYLLIICAVLSIGARAQFSGSGNGTEEDPYRIYTDIHLAQMANFLDQEGVVFELMKDVDLSSYISENSPSQGWTPIGVESTPFKGVLKGNNHTISGLTIKRTNFDNVGLFGYISGATIQDLTVEASSVAGKNFVGTLVGYSVSCTINNVTAKVSGYVKGVDKVGGLVGYASSSNMENAEPTTTQVEGASYVGGVIGYAIGSNLANADFSATMVKGTTYVGGIIGYTCDGSINTCNATCDVTSTSSIVGGIAGYLSANTVTNAKSIGNVSGTNSVGGGFGQIVGTNTLNNITSTGDIVGTANVSGIAGELAASSIVTFASCFSKGKITNSGDYTGGIVGKSNGVCINSMDDCSHFGDIKGHNYVGGLVGAVLRIDAADPTSTYQIRGSDRSSSTIYDTYSDRVVTGGTATRKLNNCTAIGNIEGNDYVGGLVGESLYASSYTSSSSTYTYSITGNYYGLYLWKNGVYMSSKLYDRHSYNIYGNDIYHYDFPRTTYTKGISTISLLNSYYSGNISATENVGGLIGHKVGGDIQNCYTYSTINGSQNVGGIAGLIEGYSDTQHAVVKSNVANNASITASAGDVGRIYGASGEYITIGALASAEGNRALTQTKVMLCGVAQDVVDDEQNGTSVGPSMLRLKANYVSWGWNFDDNWNILETECYPYKKYQAAPPVIKSTLQSQDTNISGQSMNGGTVYMYYKDRDAVSTDCDGYNWAFTTEALQSGAQVQLYADVDGMTPSYLTSATVKYPGTGTEDDPYRIYSAEDLQGATNSGYYKLMNDIDLTSWINENSPETGWSAIGRNSTVATYINGDGHKVTGLWINTTAGYNGLFSNYSAGYIKNLNVEVASGKKVKGGDYTGILIGRMANGQIINCSVKGDVEGTVNVGGVAGYITNSSVSNSAFEGKVNTATNNAFAGGMTGLADDVETTSCRVNATISTTGEGSCIGGLYGKTNNGSVTKSTADVKITASGASNYVGGLVGHITSPVTLSYSTGTVTASGNGSYTGGLVGYAEASIANSYSTANVSGTQFTAGLVGYTFSTIDKCYASGNVAGVMYGAGLIGELDGANASATNSVAANNKLELSAQSAWGCRVIGGFKNGCAEPNNSNYALNTMQVSLNNVPQKKTDDTIEGIAKTASELQTSATYLGIGWDLSKDWSIDENSAYPFLLWEVDVNPIVDITLDKTSLILPVGNTATITASVLPLSATNKRVEWKSSKESVAKVEGGVVTAIGQGSATITATTTDGSNLSATCSVSVVANHDAAIAELNTLVDNALALYNNSTEGDNVGQYAAGARAALIKVINEVRSQVSSTMEEPAIVECTTKINDAVAAFQSKKVSAGEDTDITLIANTVYIDNVEGAAGGEIELSVKMKNDIQVTGFQFNMYLPEGVSVVQDEDGFCDVTLSTQRTTTMKTNTFDSGIQRDGSLLVLAASTKNYTFSGTDGEVAKIRIAIADDVDEGEYPIVFKSITLTNAAGQTQDIGYLKRTLTVSSYTLGDVNADTKINVGDFSAIASHIMGDTPAGFVEKAADVNCDTKINVGDLSGLVTLIMNGGATQNLARMRKAYGAGFTDVSELDNVIYPSEFTVAPGADAELVFNMKNNFGATGFQFDFTLPEGMSVPEVEDGILDATLSTVRTTAQKTNTFECGLVGNNTYRVLAASTRNSEYEGNDGEVVRVRIHADENMAEGSYALNLSSITLTDARGATYDTEKLVAELTVGEEEIVYAQGYVAVFAPFNLDASGAGEATTDIYFNVASDVAQGKTVEFDLVFPQEWYDNYMISDVVKNTSLNTRFYTSSDPVDNGDGTYHFALTAKSATYYFGKVASTKIGAFTVYQDGGGDNGEYSIADGIYPITIENITVTSADEVSYNAAPITSYIKVGNPTGESLALVGHVAEEVNAALATEKALATVDMSNVVSMDGTLTLVDGRNFVAPKKDVKAPAVTYNAVVSPSLGYKTIVLPYAVDVPAGFKAYTVSGVDGNELVMDEVSTIPANTPAILENAGTAVMAASNVTIEATSDVNPTDGVLVGTYTAMTAPVGSYVLQNHDGNVAFYHVTEAVQPKVNPFRAYLREVSAEARVKLRFVENTSMISSIENEEMGEGSVFNVAGMQVNGTKKGVNIIRHADGSVTKVLVK